MIILPLEYKGDNEYVKNKLNMLILQYPKTFTNFCYYFLDYKLKYFIDGSYDYSKFPKDICSNSILERYNKAIKLELGEKRFYN